MRFFLDTANVEDIRKANDLGVICGVTTNPSLIAKEGLNFADVIKEITTIVDGPISGEVKPTTLDFEGMMNAAEAFQKMFIKTVRYVRTLGWDIYPLGAGGCRNCERCAVIDGAPCRHPEEAFPSLESHGIFVSELAQKSGMNYINGQNTVTYFGAILYR